MKKVYVVTQDWNNGETYDLHEDASKVLCVCNSLAEAKAYIADAKAKIIVKALAITRAKVGEFSGVFVPYEGRYYVDGVWFDYEHCNSPFGGFYHDEFTWWIKEFEIIGS